jgi:carbonic anhydrase
MPACCFTLRPVAAALLALSVGWCAAAEPASAAKVAASQSAAEPASAKAAKARPSSAPDPMEMLREKLAQKLGTAKAVPESPNDVQVVSKPATPVATEHARVPAPVRAAHRSTAATVSHAAGAEHGANAAHPTHWDYSGSGGPEAWGQLQPEFAKCSTGTRQSPIDIRDGIKVGLEAVQFNYQPGSFRVIDNGHTVQVNLGAGNSIEVMGRRYELVQFHFHRPSEERVDGRQFDMVVHLVHKDIDGRLAVVAVLLERGAAQPIIQNVWNNLPLEKGDEIAARGTLNPVDLLPAERNYFTYMGSLTTPPCSEGVLWMVMKQPVQVSAEQIGIFSRLYPMNARPIQSAAGRLIKESN